MIDFLIRHDGIDDSTEQELQQSFVFVRRRVEELEEGPVEVLITGDEHIRSLNRDHRGEDRATDVLAFPVSSDETPDLPEAAASAPQGSVVISWDRVLEQAEANDNSPVDEAILLFVHGLLHLAGYEHGGDAEEREMDNRTLEIASELGIQELDFGK